MRELVSGILVMDLGLKNRVVIVTGGAKGIGAACCALFVEEGARVVLVDRDAAATAALTQTLRDRGGSVEPLVVDLQDDAACARVVEHTAAAFGGLDVLVNNAGCNDAVGLDQAPDRFARSVLSNLLPAYAL